MPLSHNVRKTCSYLYLLTDLILPVLAAICLNLWAETAHIPDTYLKIERFVFYYVSLPAYVVYAWLFVSNAFPETLRDIAIAFVPLLLSILSGLVFWPGDSYTELFIYESIPFYLGLNISLCLGLIFLVCKEGKPTLVELLILLVLTTILFGPAAFTGYLATPETLQWEYFLSIGISAVCHVPLLKKLYKQGKL